MILPAFRRRVHDNKIHALYGMIVAQCAWASFIPLMGYPTRYRAGSSYWFCTSCSCFAVLAGSPRSPRPRVGYAAKSLGQLLFDAFCRDLDANLREMGVGDMGVPRRMRRFGEEFYGRQAAYQAALDGSDLPALENALARNIFELESGEARVSRLANYARASVAQLEDAKLDMLVSGERMFPDPAEFASAEL